MDNPDDPRIEDLQKRIDDLRERLDKTEERLEILYEIAERLGKVVTRGYIPLDAKLNWRDE